MSYLVSTLRSLGRSVASRRPLACASRSLVQWSRLPYPDPKQHPEDDVAMTISKPPVATVTQKPVITAAPAPAVGGAPAPAGASAVPAAATTFTPATYEGFGTPSASLLYTQAQILCQNVPKFIEKVEVVRDQLTVFARREHIQPLMLYLCHHSHSQFQQLVEMTCVDWPSRAQRFELVYMLLSLQYNSRILVKCSTDELTPVDSLVPIFPNACWYEREVYDLFGVFFAGNPDLRRILTDYGFQGHPLRKDFPISGYQEVRYDDTLKRVVYEPLELTQEFRNFDTTIPWRTMHQKVGQVVQFDPSARPQLAAAKAPAKP